MSGDVISHFERVDFQECSMGLLFAWQSNYGLIHRTSSNIYSFFDSSEERERERQKISHCYTLMCLYLCLPVCFGCSKFADTKTDSPKRNETERNAFRFDSILNIRSDAVFCSFQCGETEIERMKEGNEQKLSETVR